MSTLETYWKVFCLVRERLLRRKLDKLIVLQMKDVSDFEYAPDGHFPADL